MPADVSLGSQWSLPRPKQEHPVVASDAGQAESAQGSRNGFVGRPP